MAQKKEKKIVSYDTKQEISKEEIEAKGKDILINNKKVIFRGVNRHEFRAETGRAVSRAWMREAWEKQNGASPEGETP